MDDKTVYDNWKLDNGQEDKYECECCEGVFPEHETQEVGFIDADGDKRWLWLCSGCEESGVYY